MDFLTGAGAFRLGKQLRLLKVLDQGNLGRITFFLDLALY
jgi:hypothetical protein